MTSPKLSSSFFTSRRELLRRAMPDDSMAIISANDYYPKSADQNFPFYQNSDFYYLTGFPQEKAILCICKCHPLESMREILFIQPSNPEMEIWTGHIINSTEAKEISNIKTIMHLENFDIIIKELMMHCNNVLMWQNESPKYINSFPNANDILVKKIKSSYPLHNYQRLSPLLSQIRLVKTQEEIEIINHSISITHKALEVCIQNIKPNLFEYQIAADIFHTILWNGGSGHAFEPIVAGGENSCVLHYNNPKDKLCEGDLVLIDFGAEYEHYASDCSRTLPINGKFTQRQKDCYNAVLRVFKKARKQYFPGNTINSINNQVNKWMEIELIKLGLFTAEDVKKQNPDYPLYKKYFMHGTAHFVGLDVHDVGLKHIPLQKGMILTCEPGIYIKEEKLGIRIENMILVDNEPIDLMEHFPIEVEEFEKV